MRTARLVRIGLKVWCLCSATVVSPVGAERVVTRIEFLGEARLPRGLEFEGTPVGGLSGITYDAARDRFYVVSDDPSGRAPARFYTVEIDLDDDRLRPDAVRVVGVSILQAPEGGPMAKLTLDPEGIALAEDDSVYVSSEGQIQRLVPPFVRRFRLDGSQVGEIELPDSFRPTADRSFGPRHNLVLEGLSLSPDRRVLFVATENALYQDGPVATLESGSRSRLLAYRTATGELLAQYLYLTEPVASPAPIPDGVEVSGLVELLAVSDRRLLTMERAYSAGSGNTIRLFEIDLQAATDISGYPALASLEPGSVRPVDKRLVLDLAELDLYLDNLEGFCFGPSLSDGRRSLIIVADDNFNPLVQVNQFLAFAIDDEPVTIGEVQGRSHRSPLEGEWVHGVSGTVTGAPSDEDRVYWLEEPAADDDPATSAGIRVRLREAMGSVPIGAAVELGGRVVESRRREEDLTVTEIEALVLEIQDDAAPLPPAVRLGPGGREPPTEVIDDDGLERFDPGFDGIDFWESLEGMRVVVPAASVVGATDRYGTLVIEAMPQTAPQARTAAGGLLLRPGDANPERLEVSFASDTEVPSADVGDRFTADLEGVLDYRHGSYRLCVRGSIPLLESGGLEPETTELDGDADSLTVASFNVHNLSAVSDLTHFERLARHLVDRLRAPDIVALQEIQDDSGAQDDGTVGAGRTLGRLVEAVERLGGPRYDFRQIDPQDHGDGGRPGANIRVAFLFDASRVGFRDRVGEESLEHERGSSVAADLGRASNPFRLHASAPAFAGDPGRGFWPSRKPLVGCFTFGGRRLYLVNLHLSSKSADTGLFGAVQPQRRYSEDQRSQQAALVSDFVDDLLAAEPGASVLVLGDLNDHEFRTPLRILESDRLENLVRQLPEQDRYTFVYRGNSQMLDHVLVDRSLAESAEIRFDIVHVNADFSRDRRSSDHDPILVELDFGN